MNNNYSDRPSSLGKFWKIFFEYCNNPARVRTVDTYFYKTTSKLKQRIYKGIIWLNN